MTMPFIPNEDDATYAHQAEPDSEDFAFLQVALSGSVVIEGCEVTQRSTPNRNVQVSAGEVTIAGYSRGFNSGVVLTVAAADSSNPRIDLIYHSTSGAQILTGTPAANPVCPALVVNTVPLGTLYVPASSTISYNDAITDKRCFSKLGYPVTYRGSGTHTVSQLYNIIYCQPSSTTVTLNLPEAVYYPYKKYLIVRDDSQPNLGDYHVKIHCWIGDSFDDGDVDKYLDTDGAAIAIIRNLNTGTKWSVISHQGTVSGN